VKKDLVKCWESKVAECEAESEATGDRTRVVNNQKQIDDAKDAVRMLEASIHAGQWAAAKKESIAARTHDLRNLFRGDAITLTVLHGNAHW